MKKWGGIICVIILLITGFSITPAVGSIIEAAITEEGENVTIYFLDCTGKRPVRKNIETTESKWKSIKQELREIRKTSVTFEESFNAQINVFKQYGFISDDTTYEELEERANVKFRNKPRIPFINPLPDNVIINAICAIQFELDTCDTFVFGLNTFMNLVGLDIISVHNGHTPDGITTFGGLLAQNADPGDYAGFMFGFLGYWAGTKTGTGTYSDLAVAGFTVITLWFPISSS
jgi:hypothetical protein